MFQAFWAVFTLLYLAQIINSAPCGVTLVTPRKVVERVSRSGWLLVRGNSWEDFRKSLNIRPRQRRSIDQRKSRHCNWTDELDENVNRKPRFLHKDPAAIFLTINSIGKIFTALTSCSLIFILLIR